jgi:hypothetical protein
MQEKIEGAIIIHGPGRSGTTLFNNILSLHPEVAWLSGYINRFPRIPQLAVLNRLQEVPLFERATRGRRYFPRTAEAYDYWNFYLKCVRNYDEQCIENGNFDDLIASLRAVMRYQGKVRLVIKLTGLARGKMLEKIFYNPVVLYLDRDPRDVIVSYFKQRWLHKNDPNYTNIDRSELLKEYVDLFSKFQNTKQELHKFRFKQLRYEEFVKDPIGFLRVVNDYAGLSHHAGYYDQIRTWRIDKSSIGRWKTFLNAREVEFVSRALRPYLDLLGYPVSAQE